nr:hypothetical protein [Sphingobacterium haloxyli]
MVYVAAGEAKKQVIASKCTLSGIAIAVSTLGFPVRLSANTLAPQFASAMAWLSPKPLEAPVTMIRSPFKENVFSR